MGISPAQVYNIIGVNGKIGEKNLSKIFLAYPTLSQPWLRKEEGAMLTDGTTPAVSAEVANSPRIKRARKGGRKAAPKTEKEIAPKVKRTRRSKQEMQAAAAGKQQIDLSQSKTQEPKLAEPKKLDLPADIDSKPVPAINALIAGQRELILTNTKLVEANQQLVDLVLKFVKR
ncbi:hypothetical protein FACS189430_11360 [Bacteroidia bacterium]|nr:hypothetical protein FACS189430_11360 [Bacteroidia bacterium]